MNDTRPLHPRTKNLKGQRFGRLTVLEFAGLVTGDKNTSWLCRCDCGRELTIRSAVLISGNTVSCGCYRLETKTKHGHTRTGEYTKEWRAWYNMRARCLYPSSSRYKNYGARGIKVCDRWVDSFENFLEDVGFAPSTAHTLGRIDNDGNYEPGNVKWQTEAEQVANKSTSRLLTAFGKTQTLQEWSRETGLGHGTILRRLKLGWSDEKAVGTKPLFKGQGEKRLVNFQGKEVFLADLPDNLAQIQRPSGGEWIA
jgi:hypothetical protein